MTSHNYEMAGNYTAANYYESSGSKDSGSKDYSTHFFGHHFSAPIKFEKPKIGLPYLPNHSIHNAIQIVDPGGMDEKDPYREFYLFHNLMGKKSSFYNRDSGRQMQGSLNGDSGRQIQGSLRQMQGNSMEIQGGLTPPNLKFPFQPQREPINPEKPFTPLPAEAIDELLSSSPSNGPGLHIKNVSKDGLFEIKAASGNLWVDWEHIGATGDDLRQLGGGSLQSSPTIGISDTRNHFLDPNPNGMINTLWDHGPSFTSGDNSKPAQNALVGSSIKNPYPSFEPLDGANFNSSSSNIPKASFVSLLNGPLKNGSSSNTTPNVTNARFNLLATANTTGSFESNGLLLKAGSSSPDLRRSEDLIAQNITMPYMQSNLEKLGTCLDPPDTSIDQENASKGGHMMVSFGKMIQPVGASLKNLLWDNLAFANSSVSKSIHDEAEQNRLNVMDNGSKHSPGGFSISQATTDISPISVQARPDRPLSSLSAASPSPMYVGIRTTKAQPEGEISATKSEFRFDLPKLELIGMGMKIGPGGVGPGIQSQNQTNQPPYYRRIDQNESSYIAYQMQQNYAHAETIENILNQREIVEEIRSRIGSSGSLRKISIEEWQRSNESQSILKNLFNQVDSNNDGLLMWNNGEITLFIRLVFDAYDIILPNYLSQTQWYLLYRNFDTDNKCSLNIEQAMEMSILIHQKKQKNDLDFPNALIPAK